jgi:hypothetical protein
MSRLSPSPSNLYRSQSVVSVAASDTTYHSFYDVALFEPASPSTTTSVTKAPGPSVVEIKEIQEGPNRKLISRQDSGYESASAYTSSRSGASQSSRRQSAASTTTATSRSGNVMQTQSRSQKRPALHRAVKSTPISRVHTGQSMNLQPISSYNSHHQPQQYSNTYYYFPPPEVISGAAVEEADESQHRSQGNTPYHPPPPQTTHYWMSDHTRRLEYAAIDAASRGVKGWIMRHVVPDCFVPKDNRRLRFDDDTGSVRRYRLDIDDVGLECDDLSRKGGDCDRNEKGSGKKGKKFRWLFGR